MVKERVLMQQQFSDLLVKQQLADQKSREFLEELVSAFPYCQPARMLYAKALMESKSPLFEAQLNMASACAPDRRLFRIFLAEKQEAGHAADTQLRMEDKKSAEKPGPPTNGNHNKMQRQQNIIDRFLEETPRIRPATENNMEEGDLAAGSIEDKADLASETLAEVLLKQGKKERAMMIYNKLSLMFPEKSSYFAKKLEHIQNQNN